MAATGPCMHANFLGYSPTPARPWRACGTRPADRAARGPLPFAAISMDTRGQESIISESWIHVHACPSHRPSLAVASCSQQRSLTLDMVTMSSKKANIVMTSLGRSVICSTIHDVSARKQIEGEPSTSTSHRHLPTTTMPSAVRFTHLGIRSRQVRPHILSRHCNKAVRVRTVKLLEQRNDAAHKWRAVQGVALQEGNKRERKDLNTSLRCEARGVRTESSSPTHRPPRHESASRLHVCEPLKLQKREKSENCQRCWCIASISFMPFPPLPPITPPTWLMTKKKTNVGSWSSFFVVV